METIKSLLDQAKAARDVTTEYALAKELGLTKQQISEYYKGRVIPSEYACLQIAKALGRNYDQIQAIVRIEAEKDEDRRQTWRDYLKSIGGIAASFVIGLLICATLIVAYPTQAIANTGFSKPEFTIIQIMRFSGAFFRRLISVVQRTFSNAFPRVCLSY